MTKARPYPLGIPGPRPVLTWADYQFGTDLAERDFTTTGLTRVR